MPDALRELQSAMRQFAQARDWEPLRNIKYTEPGSAPAAGKDPA